MGGAFGQDHCIIFHPVEGFGVSIVSESMHFSSWSNTTFTPTSDVSLFRMKFCVSSKFFRVLNPLQFHLPFKQKNFCDIY